MTEYFYHLDFQVRDYELDMQGIVNNAVYQNYLEHTRHEFLKEHGINFAAYTKGQINLVVVRAEIDYKFPLQSGDRFRVGLNLVKESPLRFSFLQDIWRLPDEKPILKAKIVGTSLNPTDAPPSPLTWSRPSPNWVCRVSDFRPGKDLSRALLPNSPLSSPLLTKPVESGLLEVFGAHDDMKLHLGIEG